MQCTTDAFLSSLPPSGKSACYHAHGLLIETDRCPPRLVRADDGDSAEPVRLAFGTTPGALAHPLSQDDLYQADDSQFLFRFPDFWKIWVADGRQAVFEPLRPIPIDHIWYAGLTNAAAIAGFQRGMYPLHGSGVRFACGTVAIVGRTGRGKSTTVAGLIGRGHEIFCDDLCLVRPDADHGVGQGAPEVRLIRDSAEMLGWNLDEAIGYQPSRDKFAFHRGQPGRDILPLAGMVELAFGGDAPRLERRRGGDALVAFLDAIHLRMPPDRVPPAQRNQVFATVARMARDIPVYRLTRPRDFSYFDASLDLIEREFGVSQ